MNDDYNPDIVTLSDENGEEFTFEIIDAVETDAGKYVAMIPVHDSPEDFLDDSGELVILKVFEEEDDNFFEEIEDEDEYATVADAFMSRLQDFFEFEEELPPS